jgi:CRP-like cAMP-binding protein
MRRGAAEIVCRRLAVEGPLDDEDRRALIGLCDQPRYTRRDAVLLEEGDESASIFLLSGWAKSYQMLVDGRRAITAFHFPGDVFCLSSLLLGTGCESYAAASEAVFCRVKRSELERLLLRRPHLRRALLAQLSRHYGRMVAHFTSGTRRPAQERIACLFLEFRERALACPQDSFQCPLLQEEIGDAVGLTPVHINRVLRRLRRDGVLTLANRHVDIHDLARLKALAQYSEEEARLS